MATLDAYCRLIQDSPHIPVIVGRLLKVWQTICGDSHIPFRIFLIAPATPVVLKNLIGGGLRREGSEINRIALAVDSLCRRDPRDSDFICVMVHIRHSDEDSEIKRRDRKEIIHINRQLIQQTSKSKRKENKKKMMRLLTKIMMMSIMLIINSLKKTKKILFLCYNSTTYQWVNKKPRYFYLLLEQFAR